MAANRFDNLIRSQQAGLVGVVIILYVALAAFGGSVEREGVTVNTFLQPASQDLLYKETAYWAVMAIGATLVIISGGIDLSIGSVYCLSAVTAGMFFQHFGPTGQGAEASATWVLPVGVLICLGTGAVCGLANGVMITALGVHPFIITLGTMAIYRGLAFVMTGGQTLRNFPEALTHGFIGMQIGGLYPVPATIMIACVLAAAFLMHNSIAGRHVYAVGGNELASLYSGVRVNRVKIGVYAVSGLTGGMAALILLGDYGSANSNTGFGYELNVIAASVVGGASLSGGRGSAFGAFLGALVIKLIEKAIVIFQINQEYSRIIIGMVVICAVVLDRFSAKMMERRMTRAGA